jgi:hypothetical protein
LSIDRAEGSHSFAAVFYRKWRLYQIEGIAQPGGQGALADAIRFQQSLEFQQSLDFAEKAYRPTGSESARWLGAREFCLRVLCHE